MKYDDDRPILITGGSGFIASYLAIHLAETQNRQIVLFDRDPDIRRLTGFGDRYAKVQDLITFVQGDLTLLPHVLALFDTHEPQGVYHLGALLSAGAESNPTMGFQVDTVGTWNMLEAARLYCQKKKQDPVKFMFPSTIASFGAFIQPGQKVPNETQQMPSTMYGVSKVTCERLGEYYNSKRWVDFRAVRYPSVVGASRGPGGTTVYSTLMIQQPVLGKAYEAYVPEDTRLDILYVKDAIKAITQLYEVPNDRLKRRVYNIAGIRVNGDAPTAGDIAAAVKRKLGSADLTFKTNQKLTDTVRSFGILDDSVAHADWEWVGEYLDLDRAVADFADEVMKYPDRIKSLELFGA
jgi:nucleoside-diphosphate-sugar epimerase